jgi:CheY-like chemotaxis protein
MCPPSAEMLDLSMDAARDGTLMEPPAEVIAAPLILIVDDDPIVRSLMRDTLEDEGFEVIEAEDGVKACQRCDEVTPALLIVDAVMPKMDGFELCLELRRRAATRHVPILMATGLDDHGSIANAYDSGATDFIAKPLNWLILHHRVRYILRSANTLEVLRQNQERLRAARELEREQNERFEAALGNMSQGLCMFGADGRLIVTNRRFRDIFQLTPASVASGQSMADALKGSPLFGRETDQAADASLAEHLALASRRDSAGAARFWVQPIEMGSGTGGGRCAQPRTFRADFSACAGESFRDGGRQQLRYRGSLSGLHGESRYWRRYSQPSQLCPGGHCGKQHCGDLDHSRHRE